MLKLRVIYTSKLALENEQVSIYIIPEWTDPVLTSVKSVALSINFWKVQNNNKHLFIIVLFQHAAINWIEVINSLSVAQFFCSGGNFIVSDGGNMNYYCVEGKVATKPY